jgi:hypothetical protein
MAVDAVAVREAVIMFIYLQPTTEKMLSNQAKMSKCGRRSASLLVQKFSKFTELALGEVCPVCRVCQCAGEHLSLSSLSFASKRSGSFSPSLKRGYGL